MAENARVCELALQKYYDIIAADLNSPDYQAYLEKKKTVPERLKVVNAEIAKIEKEWEKCVRYTCCKGDLKGGITCHEVTDPIVSLALCMAVGTPEQIQECTDAGGVKPTCKACYNSTNFSKIAYLYAEREELMKPIIRPTLPSDSLPPLICAVIDCRTELTVTGNLAADLQDITQMTICVGAITDPSSTDVTDEIIIEGLKDQETKKRIVLFGAVIAVVALLVVGALIMKKR